MTHLPEIPRLRPLRALSKCAALLRPRVHARPDLPARAVPPPAAAPRNRPGEIADALARGHVRPWFQPQVDARDGRVVGVEALARWHPPDGRVRLPAAFLPAIRASGLSIRLGDAILSRGLRALTGWDAAGRRVPRLAVNLSPEQLSDPGHADRFLACLAAHDVPPHRIAAEILETVALDGGCRIVSANLHRLRAAGVRLDLDDVDAGDVPVGPVVRLGIARVKIDRRAVRDLQDAPARRDLVASTIALVRAHGAEALAEGVETPAERDALLGLGCPRMQGFLFARAMPPGELEAWLHARGTVVPVAPRPEPRAGLSP